MSDYTAYSPYFSTTTYGSHLDVMTARPISKLASDIVYTIDATYNHRPDMLAYDLYGSSRLWWVFAARNPNTLINPLFDFVAGTVIYLPEKSTLSKDLSI